MKNEDLLFNPPKDPESLEKLSLILKKSLNQKRIVPDGKGGVKKVSDKPDNCLGPILMHLHQNAFNKTVQNTIELTPDGRMLSSTPYYAAMNLVELLSHMAEAEMLPDWSYLVLHHQSLVDDALCLPYACADAVLRNGWGAKEYSILANIVCNHFAPAYTHLVGDGLGENQVCLQHSLEESSSGFSCTASDDSQKYHILFNTGSTVFTANDVIAAANALIPMVFAQVITHKLFAYDGVIPADLFEAGGTHVHISKDRSVKDKVFGKPNVGVVLPPVDFTDLSASSGLSHDDLANMLHRLTAAKLGFMLSQVYVYGINEVKEAGKASEFARGFNAQEDAILASVSDYVEMDSSELKRLFTTEYGDEATERMRWDLTVYAVDYAIISEHIECISDEHVKAEARERLDGLRVCVDAHILALGDSYDFEGVVESLRQAYCGIMLELN